LNSVDWIYYRQRPDRVPGGKWNYFFTLLIDLSKSSEALLEGCKKPMRYNIKRARDADKFTCECPNPVTEDMLRSFGNLYEVFAEHKGLGSLDCSRLEQLAKDGALDFSIAKGLDGKALVHHLYYRSTSRSCLMHSVSFHDALKDSSARNAIARANCLLTWCDMLRHKEQGLRHFDFGGWYPGKADQAKLNINRFKEGFGGTVVCEYNCEQILTLRGRLFLAAAAIIERGKGIARKHRDVQASNPGTHTPCGQDTLPAQPRGAVACE
jgi:hypothetical protein